MALKQALTPSSSATEKMFAIGTPQSSPAVDIPSMMPPSPCTSTLALLVETSLDVNQFLAEAGSTRIERCPPHGIAAETGKRPAMEDHHTIRPSLFQVNTTMLANRSSGSLVDASCESLTASAAGDMESLHFFAVYDGHGGGDVAALCADRLHHHLCSAINSLDLSSDVVCCPRLPRKGLDINPPSRSGIPINRRNTLAGGSPSASSFVGSARSAASKMSSPGSVLGTSWQSIRSETDVASSIGTFGTSFGRQIVPESPRRLSAPPASLSRCRRRSSSSLVQLDEGNEDDTDMMFWLPEDDVIVGKKQDTSRQSRRASELCLDALDGRVTTPGSPMNLDRSFTSVDGSARRRDSDQTGMMEAALKGAFLRTDQEVVDVCGARAQTMGTTAVVALVGKSHIWVAHCGDTRAVLSQGGYTVELTNDHKPSREDERMRISAAGGQMVHHCGSLRVEGVLAITRAIGDHALAPFVTPEPEVTCVRRGPDDELLVMATDGLWDVLTSEAAVNMARRTVASAKERGASRGAAARIAAKILARAAIDCGSSDNVTVVVVDLMADAQ